VRTNENQIVHSASLACLDLVDMRESHAVGDIVNHVRVKSSEIHAHTASNSDSPASRLRMCVYVQEWARMIRQIMRMRWHRCQKVRPLLK
jgi:hypothetical protein